jgi:hypothetical protein
VERARFSARLLEDLKNEPYLLHDIGIGVCAGVPGEGIAFELVNGSSVDDPTGGYQSKTLVGFPNFFPDPNGNGTNPVGGLIADAAGDLFGTTEFGGTNGEGTVFELVPQNQGVYYTATTLFSFDGSDGAAPQAGLLADSAGDFFGTTGARGTDNLGTVFELVNNGNGSYTATTLLSFDGTNGASPEAGLIANAAGDLFGTTASGGADGDGTVFELVNNGNGSYTQTTMLSFDGTNGWDPQGGLLADAAGDLFGVTALGGTNGLGTVFELVKNADGSYTPVTLVNFDGADPLGGLIADAAGNLFGTTLAGGTGNGGTVFELSGAGFQVACYGRGTLIEIARGQKKVEDLSIGDKVRTASGELRQIKGIGRRSYGGRFIMGRKDILPICFKRGSLADNVPKRDLWISPHHAMAFDDDAHGRVLIEAKDLVNGVSIVQAEQVDSVQYLHIEFETHDVIIAEGALSETFVDDVSRGMFHIAHEYAALYPDDAARTARYCAPRLDEGYEIEAIRRRLALRAGLRAEESAVSAGPLRGYVDRITPHVVEGWAQNTDHPEAPVCLDIHAGGRLIGQVLDNLCREDLEHAGIGGGWHGSRFDMPAGIVAAPHAVVVQRSLDGQALPRSAQARRTGVSTAA